MDWERFSNPKRWLTSEQRAELDDLVLKIITDSYKLYREHGGREPTLTTTYIVEDITTNRPFGREAGFNLLKPARRRNLVSASLRRLSSRGLLSSSLCPGERHAEVKCWEPTEAAMG